jgi:hypothetical protein
MDQERFGRDRRAVAGLHPSGRLGDGESRAGELGTFRAPDDADVAVIRMARVRQLNKSPLLHPRPQVAGQRRLDRVADGSHQAMMDIAP